MLNTKVISGTYTSGLKIFDNLPFDAQRFFIMDGKVGDVRGEHAHRECKQLLFCMSGKIRLTSDNGGSNETFDLDPSKGYALHDVLHWLTIEFLETSSVLVLAQYPYNEAEYIRNYNVFKEEAIA